MSDDKDRVFEWEDEIENDSPDFILLPKGDYDFEVTSYERARYPGGEKLPPCNQAIVHIKISTPEGDAIIKHNLYLHSKTEGLLCAFFTGIGQRKKGEKIKMNWNTVVGARGRCKVGIREYTKNNGDKATVNQIEDFYEPQGDTAQQAKPAFKKGEF